MKVPESPRVMFRRLRVMSYVELQRTELSPSEIIDGLEAELLDEVVYKHNYAPTGMILTRMEKSPGTCEVAILSVVIGEPSTQAEGAD